MSKATQLTLKKLRDAQYTVDIVERWLPRGDGNAFGNRHDMFGFADIVALRPDMGIVAVQSTTMNHWSDHRASLVSSENVGKWLKCGGRVFLIAWEKKHRRRKDGKATKGTYWTPRWEEIKSEDLSGKGGGAKR